VTPVALVFDLGGVVCRFRPQARLAALSRASGLGQDVVHRALWGSGLDARAERGALGSEEAVDAVLDALERRIDRPALIGAWSKAFVPNGPLCALVRELPRPLFAFSNNGPVFGECLAHELGDVVSLFDRVVLSWQVSATKPDPVAFTRLAAALDIAPQASVVVDDATENCRAARSVGFRAVRYRGPAALRRRLATWVPGPAAPGRA